MKNMLKMALVVFALGFVANGYSSDVRTYGNTYCRLINNEPVYGQGVCLVNYPGCKPVTKILYYQSGWSSDNCPVMNGASANGCNQVNGLCNYSTAPNRAAGVNEAATAASTAKARTATTTNAR